MKRSILHVAAYAVVTVAGAWAQQPVVAVLNFENQSGKFYLDDAARSFGGLLKTELAQSRSLVVVERQKIDAILTEQDFTLSDLVEDPDKQAKVGNLLGADYLITGTVVESEGKVRIDAAVTQIRTGKVSAEKVVAPSRDHLGTAAKLMANNIVFELSGQGSRQSSIHLRGAPSTAFFVSTVALAGAAAVSLSKRNHFVDQYEGSGDLKKISDTYDKANKWSKATVGLTSAAVISAGAWIYCILKNRSADLEVLAHSDRPSGASFAILPTAGIHSGSTQWGAQIRIDF